jgi:hypothetical protein
MPMDPWPGQSNQDRLQTLLSSDKTRSFGRQNPSSLLLKGD